MRLCFLAFFMQEFGKLWRNYGDIIMIRGDSLMSGTKLMNPHDIELSYTFFSPDKAREFNHNRLWAVSQQADGRWAIILDHPGGYIEPTNFAKLGDLVAQYHGVVKMTCRQQLLIVVEDRYLENMIEQLDKLKLPISRFRKGLRGITVCVGSNLCINSFDKGNLQLARDLSKRFRNVILPWSFKVGFSGCSRNCSLATSNCLGLINTPSGFTITLGGSSSKSGQILLTDCSEKDLVRIFELVLKAYVWFAEKYHEKYPNNNRIKMHHLVDYFGIGVFQDLLTNLDKPATQEVSKFRRSDLDCTTCGFSKESAFYTFLAVEKACPQCQPCSKSTCQLYFAKSILTNASSTGNKYNDHLPPDFLDMLRALPLVDRGISPYYLQEAYQSALTNCDHCDTRDHFSFCSVNLAVTALGILLYGHNYQTEADQAKLNISNDNITNKP